MIGKTLASYFRTSGFESLKIKRNFSIPKTDLSYDLEYKRDENSILIKYEAALKTAEKTRMYFNHKIKMFK